MLLQKVRDFRITVVILALALPAQGSSFTIAVKV